MAVGWPLQLSPDGAGPRPDTLPDRQRVRQTVRRLRPKHDMCWQADTTSAVRLPRYHNLATVVEVGTCHR